MSCLPNAIHFEFSKAVQHPRIAALGLTCKGQAILARWRSISASWHQSITCGTMMGYNLQTEIHP